MVESSVRPHQIALKSARAIIPGFGPEGEPFGQLVPTSEILAGIRPRRPSLRPSSQENTPDLPPGWLERLLGFKSIATTNVTHEVANAAIESGLAWDKLGAELVRPAFNADVDAMLTLAVQAALADYRRLCHDDFSASRSIVGHIHIAATSNVHTPYALLEARAESGCHKPGLPIVNLLSGCSGLLFAMQQARFLLLETAALRDDDAFVLITCSNDLLPFAHARGRCPTSRNREIDEWLFQAIFGEGTGAIIVGHAHRGGGDWIVEDLGWEAVTDEWRVTMTRGQGADSSMLIRAKQVSATFREHVPRVARRGIEALGVDVTQLHRLCVHESNPNLVSQVAAKLQAPASTVHSISPLVGTLAGVSAFSLLDEALRSYAAAPSEHGAIVCALIGEAGNSVVAGHLALRHANDVRQRLRRAETDPPVGKVKGS